MMRRIAARPPSQQLWRWHSSLKVQSLRWCADGHGGKIATASAELCPYSATPRQPCRLLWIRDAAHKTGIEVDFDVSVEPVDCLRAEDQMQPDVTARPGDGCQALHDARVAAELGPLVDEEEERSLYIMSRRVGEIRQRFRYALPVAEYPALPHGGVAGQRRQVAARVQ